MQDRKDGRIGGGVSVPEKVPSSGSTPRASPHPATLLMVVGYVAGTVGLALGFNRLGNGAADAIEPVALLAVGMLGVVSFVRHAVFHRSDAARMKWDIGRTNNFQIEVGMANLAWGLLAIATVVWDWGVPAQAVVTAVFGIYLLLASGIHLRILVAGPLEARRGAVPAVATALVGGMLTFFAVAALAAESVRPFG